MPLHTASGKHGCALEICALAKVFAFGLASNRRDQEKRPHTRSAVQRSPRRMPDGSLCPTDKAHLSTCVQVPLAPLAGVDVSHAWGSWQRCHWHSATAWDVAVFAQNVNVLNRCVWVFFLCWHVCLLKRTSWCNRLWAALLSAGIYFLHKVTFRGCVSIMHQYKGNPVLLTCLDWDNSQYRHN